MKTSIKKGLGFGLTSGIITTIGLIVGLNSGTHSINVILAGILIIAIADSLSDALGMHISEESSDKNNSHKEIWESTISTFIFKLIIALTFIIPFLLFKLNMAIIASILWGFFLLLSFTFYFSKKQGRKPWGPLTEHLVIATIVIILTNLIGKIIPKFLN